MTVVAGTKCFIPFDIPATELGAGTAIDLVSPVAGVVETLIVLTQTAIVTGGVVTAKIGTTDVTGLSITVADAATKGTIQTDDATSGTATRTVAKYGRLQVVPSAAFNGGGALSGYLVVNSNDLSPVQPF